MRLSLFVYVWPLVSELRIDVFVREAKLDLNAKTSQHERPCGPTQTFVFLDRLFGVSLSLMIQIRFLNIFPREMPQIGANNSRKR